MVDNETIKKYQEYLVKEKEMRTAYEDFVDYGDDIEFYKDIYQETLCEDNNFIFDLCYSINNGFRIYFINKDNEYPVYFVLKSYAQFYEWLGNVFKASDIINLEHISKKVKKDLSNFNEVIEEIRQDNSTDYQKKRLKLFFDYIANNVKVILGLKK